MDSSYRESIDEELILVSWHLSRVNILGRYIDFFNHMQFSHNAQNPSLDLG